MYTLEYIQGLWDIYILRFLMKDKICNPPKLTFSLRLFFIKSLISKISQSVNQSISQFSQLVNQSIRQSVNQSIYQSFN